MKTIDQNIISQIKYQISDSSDYPQINGLIHAEEDKSRE